MILDGGIHHAPFTIIEGLTSSLRSDVAAGRNRRLRAVAGSELCRFDEVFRVAHFSPNAAISHVGIATTSTRAAYVHSPSFGNAYGAFGTPLCDQTASTRFDSSRWICEEVKSPARRQPTAKKEPTRREQTGPVVTTAAHRDATSEAGVRLPTGPLGLPLYREVNGYAIYYRRAV